MLTLEEKKKAHLEFMLSALNGLMSGGIPNAQGNTPEQRIEFVTKRACLVADIALETYEKRWEEEGKEGGV